MNGIEKITARITAEANEAAAAVIAEAEKTAGEIRAVYQKKADEAYEARMNEGNTEVRLGAEREQRAAKLQSRKDTLALKQSILERAYGRAKEKLLALPEEKYTAFLASQAGHAAVTGHERIVINSQDRSMGEAIVRGANAILTERGLPAGLTLSDESGDFSGKTVIPFATSGGSGMGKTADILRAVCPAADILPGKRMSTRESAEAVRAWLETLRK